MIYGVEKARSGRARCRKCFKFIKKTKKRVIFADWKYGHRENYFFCKGCGKEIIDEEQKRLNLMMEILK